MQQYSNDTGLAYDDWYDRGQARARNTAIGIAAAVVLGGVIAGLLWWHRHTHPAIVPAPASFASYTAPDGGFMVAEPVGWKASESASMAVNSGVDFKQGPCSISVTSDLSGSLMGDIAQSQATQQQNIAQQAGLPTPNVTPPVEKLHEAGKQDMAGDYPGYVEQPMQQFTCPAGPARVSEWTSDDGGKNPIDHLHGYRATILSNQRRITVVEVCPEQNWSILQQPFQHVLESVAVGPQQ